MIESNEMIEKYDQITSDLLEWIKQTITILSDRNFANSLTGKNEEVAWNHFYFFKVLVFYRGRFAELIMCIFVLGVQQQLTAFNSYRTQEKPGKFEEKGNLEVLLFTLQSKMRANNQKPYLPKEGKLVSDINKVKYAVTLI